MGVSEEHISPIIRVKNELAKNNIISNSYLLLIANFAISLIVFTLIMVALKSSATTVLT
jgi:hypothetical protein